MAKTTNMLLNKLLKTNNLDEYIRQEEKEFIVRKPCEVLSEIFKTKNVKKCDMIWEMQMSPSFLHQIFSGKRVPSRDKFIGICIAMSATLQETQAALKAVGMAPLYAKNIRDSVIIFGMNQKLNCIEINEILFEKKLGTI